MPEAEEIFSLTSSRNIMPLGNTLSPLTGFRKLSGPVKPLTIEDTDREGTTFVLPMVPSRGLGGFMTGTLNFFSGKARALMQLGYTDTIKALQEYDMSDLSPTPRSSF